MADWKSLTDGEWVNIVNSDAVKNEGSDVHGAVCAAFKLIEARLREKNEPKTSLDHFIDDVEAAEKQAPEALQELHGLLYLAQRTTGEAQAESIGKARLLLSRLRDVPQAEPDLTEDGAIWKAIIAWADARNSAHAVSGGHAAAVDSAIRAATTEECPYCHDCWPECLHCDATGRATPSTAMKGDQP